MSDVSYRRKNPAINLIDCRGLMLMTCGVIRHRTQLRMPHGPYRKVDSVHPAEKSLLIRRNAWLDASRVQIDVLDRTTRIHLDCDLRGDRFRNNKLVKIDLPVRMRSSLTGKLESPGAVVPAACPLEPQWQCSAAVIGRNYETKIAGLEADSGPAQ